MSARAPKGLLAWLLDRFGPRITVQVDPDAFLFTTGKTAVHLGTFLYLDTSGGTPRVLAVGEEVPMVAGVIRVDLFRNANGLSTSAINVSKMDCLSAFCRLGIQKLTRRSSMIRPHVTVIGLATLDPVLHGYQATVLRQALESTGASMIVFAESGAPDLRSEGSVVG